MSIVSSRQGLAGKHRNPLFGQRAQREEAIVRRRENERMKNEFWFSTAKYFGQIHNQTERFSQWTSPDSIKKSEEAFRKAKLAETRKENLMSRRSKLKALLMAEESHDLEQMRKLPAGVARKSSTDIRQEYEKMKMQRIEEQQKEADEKMLHHWKINNPEYRELQCKKRFEMVQKAWDEQLSKKKEIEEAERRQEEIRLRVEAEKELRKDAEEKDRQREREQKIQDWKTTIIGQIEQLKSRRKEEEQIKRELAEEQDRQKQMEEAEVKRRKIEEKRKAASFKEFLDRQHRLKLLSKTQQIQKELEEDKRLLEEITAFTAAQDAHQIEERNEKNQRLTWLKDVIDMQKKEEARRQKEMELLFSEEAEKMWHKQEVIWRREEDARKRLIEDVMSGLKEQIRVKVQEKKRHEELVAIERSKIEENIDRLSKDIQQEESERQRKRDMFVEDLDNQVEEKKAAKTTFNRGEIFRSNNELASKLKKLHMTDTEPVITDFRRRRAKWY